MKRNSIFLPVLIAVFVTAAAMRPITQDDPKKTGQKTHIKMVTVKDGKKQVLDTVIESNDIKVMHLGKGNTITRAMSGTGTSSDTISEEIEIVKGNGKVTHVTVHKHGGEKGNVLIRELNDEGDSGKQVVVHVEKSIPHGENVIITGPGRNLRHRVAGRPLSFRMRGINTGMPSVRPLRGRNVIDLTDPGIISYEKKKLSGGREKITIIRNEPKEEDNESGIRVAEPPVKLPGIDVPHVEKEIKVLKKELAPEPIEKK